MNYEIFSSNNCSCGKEGMKREGAPTKDFPQFSIGGSNDGAESSHQKDIKIWSMKVLNVILNYANSV